MCCSFWQKCKNSPKTGLGCSTHLKLKISLEIKPEPNFLYQSTIYLEKKKKFLIEDSWIDINIVMG